MLKLRKTARNLAYESLKCTNLKWISWLKQNEKENNSFPLLLLEILFYQDGHKTFTFPFWNRHKKIILIPPNIDVSFLKMVSVKNTFFLSLQIKKRMFLALPISVVNVTDFRFLFSNIVFPWSRDPVCVYFTLSKRSTTFHIKLSNRRHKNWAV